MGKMQGNGGGGNAGALIHSGSNEYRYTGASLYFPKVRTMWQHKPKFFSTEATDWAQRPCIRVG